MIFVSAFRNMAPRVARYFDQVAAFRDYQPVGHNVEVIAVEGDSRDATEFVLRDEAAKHNIPLVLVKHNHGLRHFGSTEEPERLSALTGVMMAGMREAGRINAPDTPVVYVESDLLWTPQTIRGLILTLLGQQDFQIIAPMVFAGDAFYDVWGFRANGQRFGPFPPYHEMLKHEEVPTGIEYELDSAGSCLCFRAEVAARVEPSGQEALVSWCRGARMAGYRIGVVPALRVHHP